MRFILALFFTFSISFLSAQLNDTRLYVDIKANQLEEIYINSLSVPKVQIHNYDLTDSIGFDPDEISPQLYKLNYQAISDLSGDFQTVIEYTEPSTIPGIPQKNYSVLNFNVNSSKITTEDDFSLVQPGTTILDPLANDISTDGPLTLVKLGHVSGGTASITSDNKIAFNLSSENGTILYFAEDSTGTVASAFLKVTEENNSLSQTKNLFAAKNQDLQLVLSSSDYTPLASPQDGSLTNDPNHSHVWSYRSDTDFSGTDVFSFESSTGSIIDYEVSVLNTTNNNSFVIDDKVHLPVDGTITIDVLANDYRSDMPIISHSAELIEISNGVYEFTAPNGYSGDLEFEYKVFTGLQIFTGTITVHVSDFAPTEVEQYEFSMIQDKALRINHNTPISDYFFDGIFSPSNGSIEIFDEFDNQLVGCDSVSGANTIIYTPNAGFTGTDEFDINYCTSSGSCEIVKVDVQVLSSTYSDCLCLSDCVYEGDHNDDGRVDFLDILDLGLNIGEGGLDRSADFDETWSGLYSDNWGHTQIGSSIDLKCGDSDGDGYIDSGDFLAIDEHYGKLSKFQTAPSTATTEVPVYFIPQSTSVDSGELLILDIAIGDEYFPAIDMNGLAFSFNIAAELIDSSSVNFYLYDDNWMGYNNPITDYSIVPHDGQVDIAVTRLGRLTANGHGIIGALEFIVEDEITGLKRARHAAEEFLVEMNNILSVNGHGEYVSHPNYSQKISSDFENNELVISNEYSEGVSVFPNPSSGEINIASINGLLDKIEVTDVVGQTLSVNKFQSTDLYQTDLSQYEDGVYFITIYSEEKVTTRKVHKVNR